MDFGLTDKQKAFREEVCTFLKKELPPGWRGMSWEEMAVSDDAWIVFKEMSRKLGDKGWLTLDWPKEYGGLAYSHVETSIFKYEMAHLGAPGVDPFGISMLAPTLMRFGSEEQKKRHLIPIAKGEVVWCEGFSEPEAGSDLASLWTLAVEQGDSYVINGQKVWTSGAHRADWCFLLAKTNPQVPKHQGISFFLVNMKTHGVEVRPLVNAADRPAFNEVFFDDVRVPKENLVGELNNGWLVANALLSFERSTMDLVGQARRMIDILLEFAINNELGRDMLMTKPLMRQRLAQIEIDMEVAKLLNYHVAWMQDHGLNPDSEAAQAKVFVTELLQRIANTAMQMLGLYGPLSKDSAKVLLSGMVAHEYPAVLGMTILGGTSEILRTVIARRGLGLSRS